MAPVTICGTQISFQRGRPHGRAPSLCRRRNQPNTGRGTGRASGTLPIRLLFFILQFSFFILHFAFSLRSLSFDATY